MNSNVYLKKNKFKPKRRENKKTPANPFSLGERVLAQLDNGSHGGLVAVAAEVQAYFLSWGEMKKRKKKENGEFFLFNSSISLKLTISKSESTEGRERRKKKIERERKKKRENNRKKYKEKL